MTKKSLPTPKKNVNQFIATKRQEAAKIDISQRSGKFIEIYQPMDEPTLKVQAERCLECGVAYCQWKCPVHNYIPGWLKLAYEGRIDEAVQLSHQTNSLPEICGRVCPQDRLCEGSCTLNDGFGAVTIGNVEKYITDTAFANGWQFEYPELADNARKIAVVGSGPAGIACADVLRRLGYKVTVFERQAQIGGLLTYGIPGFKLEKDLILRRHQLLASAGIEFKLNTEIGREITLEQLSSDYAAVFIGVGTYQAVTDSVVNQPELTNVILALDFLESINKQVVNASPLTSDWNVAGKKVVVLGGGDTTMDCIRSSIRLGASEAVGVYRGCEDRLPGSRKEFINVTEEGGRFIFNAQAVAVIHENGVVKKIRFIRTEEHYNGNVCALKPLAGSEFEVECDLIITAFGFRAEELPWLNQLSRDSVGRIKVGGSMTQQTSAANVFAGGDIVRGASLVVHAIADGMQAAREIQVYLESQHAG